MGSCIQTRNKVRATCKNKNMGLKSPFLLLFVATTLAYLVKADWNTHSSASDLYIHSNDTFTLELSDDQPNQLHGAPGTRRTLHFILKNNGRERSYFIINQESEDRFIGQIDRNEIALSSGDQHKITVRNLIVPDLKDGMKIRYSLVARREQNKRRKKREEDPNNRPGGSVNSPGGSSYNPGGSSYNPPISNNPGGSSSYNPGGGNYNPGGSNQYNPGTNGGGIWNPDRNDHASYRRQASVTLEFTITEPGDEFEDETEPETELEYGADSEDETCSVKPGEPNCGSQWWWAKFRVQDDDSGLHSVKVTPAGKETYASQVYYRYINFPIGSTMEHEVYAAASCCIESMRLTVKVVAGETAERYAVSDGTGSGGLSKTAIYAIVGASVGVVLIIIIVVVVVVCKNKYSEVSQNP